MGRIGLDWNRYRQDVESNSDYRKFDGLLPEVLSGRPAACLTVFMLPDRRLLTRLVFDRDGDHVHGVDGSNGGYAQAAVALKRQREAGRP